MSFSVSANKEQGTNLGGFGEERGVVDNRLDLNNHSFRLEYPHKDEDFHSRTVFCDVFRHVSVIFQCRSSTLLSASTP